MFAPRAHALAVTAALLVMGCTGQALEPEGREEDPEALVEEPNTAPQNQEVPEPTDEGEPLVAPVVDPEPENNPTGAVFQPGDKVLTPSVTNLRYDVDGTTRGDVIRVVAAGTELTVVADGGVADRFLRAKIGALPVFVARAGLKSTGVSTENLGQAVVARALGAVGFSYYWGHGSWTTAGASVATTGSCSGSCPNCEHVGKYGADCSGLVAKAWQIPSGNDDITVDKHPYNTANFVAASSKWSFIDRGALKAGDALAYNASGAGHTFIYRTGDGWGSFWSIEARGCSYGIVHNLRTAGSNYKSLRKK